MPMFHSAFFSTSFMDVVATVSSTTVAASSNVGYAVPNRGGVAAVGVATAATDDRCTFIAGLTPPAALYEAWRNAAGFDAAVGWSGSNANAAQMMASIFLDLRRGYLKPVSDSARDQSFANFLRNLLGAVF